VESYKVVRPEHLNSFGYLFGGVLLKWVDEIGWIAASRDYPGCNFVTVSMDKVEFRSPVRQGTVLRFYTGERQTGNTSVDYEVRVNAVDLKTGAEDIIFTTHMRFVCLDTRGKKTPLNHLSLSTAI
jgi:acyl-CoA hydrolase